MPSHGARLVKRIFALSAVLTVGAALFAMLFFGLPYDMGSIFGTGGELYQARTIVTGQRDETRIPGFERCLEDVLKKISGDPSITSDEVAASAAGRARDYVKEFHEHDRMEGIPIHDEQGTRDRPFDLTVAFYPRKIDALLESLGRKPWVSRRPTIMVLLLVNNGNNVYILTNDADMGFDQRESFMSAAWQTGMPIILPTAEVLDRSGLSAEGLHAASSADLEKLASANEGDLALVGSIVWNSGMLGWKADWLLYAKGTPHEWQIQDVNFDDAFRSAMRGAAQILSGHGEP